jgi:hypothetical protein
MKQVEHHFPGPLKRSETLFGAFDFKVSNLCALGLVCHICISLAAMSSSSLPHKSRHHGSHAITRDRALDRRNVTRYGTIHDIGSVLAANPAQLQLLKSPISPFQIILFRLNALNGLE